MESAIDLGSALPYLEQRVLEVFGKDVASLGNKEIFIDVRRFESRFSPHFSL